ncbi:uncharacterized protein TNCV_481721 [Trichonephila clavipes]|nr:uncharacterized protein TNCV_481721 [Trichonephila clavipes]
MITSIGVICLRANLNERHADSALFVFSRKYSPLKRKGGMFPPATLKPVVCTPTNRSKSKVPSFDLSGAPPLPLYREGRFSYPVDEDVVLTRFLSGHLMSLTFVDDIKHFEICTKCSSAEASPGPILFCLGLTRQDLVQDPLLVLDFFRVNGLMDLI